MVGSIEHLRRKWRLRRERNLRRSVAVEIASGLRGQMYVDRGGGPEDTTFLAGHDRSGTTWIAEILNHAHDYRYIFEPFTPGRLDITSVFRPRQYLRPDEHDPRFLGPAEAIVTGRIRSLWTDKYNRALAPKQRLVKDVRSNLLLPWLSRNFPEMRMGFVLRHPCAVAHSRLNVSPNWGADLQHFLNQQPLVEDHLRSILHVIESAQDEFERHIVVWCLDNFVPLRLLRRRDVHVAFYEDFCLEPEREVARLLTFVGGSYDRRVLRSMMRPSATTRRDSAVVSGDSLIDGWRAFVTPSQVDRAAQILAGFGLDRIYGTDSLPLSRTPLDD
jgi:hypothetical protein